MKQLRLPWTVVSLLTAVVSSAVTMHRPSAAAPVAPQATYSENFDTLANSGTSSTVPAGWTFAEAGSGGNTSYTAGTGSSTTGDTYSFGSAGSTERAFGGLQTSSLATTVGASFTNNAGAPVGSLELAYSGEQWRLGALGRVDRLDFQYSLDATSLTTGSWVDVDALDFTAPVTTGSVGALNGNDAANRTAVSFTITGLNIADGSSYWIRWTDLNATGSDDGLGVDDFSLTATAASATPTDLPTVTISATAPPTVTEAPPSPTPTNTATPIPTSTPTLPSSPTPRATDTPLATSTPAPTATPTATDVAGQGLPMPVQLAYFTARRWGSLVRLEWATISELHHAGFRLWRESPGGRQVPVGPRLIPARGGELSGAGYLLIDDAAPTGALRYWLDDVSSTGNATRHGPARVPRRMGHGLGLAAPTDPGRDCCAMAVAR